MPTTQNGTLTQNSQRQSSECRITPPTTGPRIGPSTTGRLIMAIVRPRLRPRAACMTRVDSSGSIRPPPMPCTTRKPIRLGAFQARLHRIDPIMKMVSAIIHSRFPPVRAWAQATIGMTTPSESR